MATNAERISSMLDDLEKQDMSETKNDETNEIIVSDKTETGETDGTNGTNDKGEKSEKSESTEGTSKEPDKNDKGVKTDGETKTEEKSESKTDGTDDTSGEGKKEGEEEVKEKKDPRDDEIAELRYQVRELKKANKELDKKYSEVNKHLEDAKIKDPEDETEKKELETLRIQRDAILDSYLENMRLNPNFEDVDEVCSESHFSDLIDLMADAVVSKEPKLKKDDVVAGLESEIWAMTNPYRFMYEQIKLYHPDYRKSAAASEEDKSGDDSTKTAKTKEKTEAEKVADAKKNKQPDVKTTATSTADMGTGTHKSGWTAAQIDGLPESELSKVPKDVYDLYMKDMLP